MARSATGTAGHIGPARDVQAVTSPYVDTISTGSDRHLIALDSSSGQPWGIDFAQLRKENKLNSKVGMILGRKNNRKTSLAQKLIFNDMDTDPGDGSDNRVYMTEVRRKPLPDGTTEGEDDGFARLFNSEPIRYRQALNFFDPGFMLGAGEHFRTVMDAHAIATGMPATITQAMCYQAALETMLTRYGPIASLPTLGLCLADLTKSPRMIVESLSATFGGQLTKHLNDREDGDAYEQDAVYRELAQASDTTVVNPYVVRQAAFECMASLKRLIGGDFDGRFGGFTSFADLMSQQAVVFDMAGMGDKTLAFMQSFIWRLKRLAIIEGTQKFFFHAEKHDENYRDWNILPYAEAVSDYVKQARTTDALLLFITHRIRDYLSVGQADSRQRQLATNFIGDIDFWFIGNLSRPDAHEIGERLGFEPAEIDAISEQGPGEFTVKIGEQPVQRINANFFTSDVLMEANRTNQAADQRYAANH